METRKIKSLENVYHWLVADEVYLEQFKNSPDVLARKAVVGLERRDAVFCTIMALLFSFASSGVFLNCFPWGVNLHFVMCGVKAFFICLAFFFTFSAISLTSMIGDSKLVFSLFVVMVGIFVLLFRQTILFMQLTNVSSIAVIIGGLAAVAFGLSFAFYRGYKRAKFLKKFNAEFQ